MIAAGSVSRAERQRENGPATRTVARAQQCAGSSRLARRKWRTFADADGAPRLARLLEVLVELVRPGSCTVTRTQHALAVWTEICARPRMRGLTRECRASAARWAWRLERVAVRTYKGAQSRCCSMLKPHDSQAGRRDGCCCGNGSSSVCPSRCSSPRAAARSSNLAERPSAAQGCRSPEELGRARRGICRTGRTHEGLRTECARHLTLQEQERKVRFRWDHTTP